MAREAAPFLEILQGVFDHDKPMPDVERQSLEAQLLSSAQLVQLRQAAFALHDFVFFGTGWHITCSQLLDLKKLIMTDENGHAVLAVLALVCLAHDPDYDPLALPLKDAHETLRQRWPHYGEVLFRDVCRETMMLPFLLVTLSRLPDKYKVKELNEVLSDLEYFIDMGSLRDVDLTRHLMPLFKKIFKIKLCSLASVSPLLTKIESYLAAGRSAVLASPGLRALLVTMGRFIRLRWQNSEPVLDCYIQFPCCAEFLFDVDTRKIGATSAVLKRITSITPQGDRQRDLHFLHEQLDVERMGTLDRFKLDLIRLRMLRGHRGPSRLSAGRPRSADGSPPPSGTIQHDFFQQFLTVWQTTQTALAATAGMTDFRSHLVDFYIETVVLRGYPPDHHLPTRQLWNEIPCDFRLATLSHLAAARTQGSFDTASLRAMREKVSRVDGTFFSLALMGLEQDIYRRSYYDHVYRQLSDEQKKTCLMAATHALGHIRSGKDSRGPLILKSLKEYYLADNSFLIKGIIQQKPMEGQLLLLGLAFYHAHHRSLPPLSREQYLSLTSAMAQSSHSIRPASILDDLLSRPFLASLADEIFRGPWRERVIALLAASSHHVWRRRFAEALSEAMKKRRVPIDFNDRPLVDSLLKIAGETGDHYLRGLLAPILPKKRATPRRSSTKRKPAPGEFP